MDSRTKMLAEDKLEHNQPVAQEERPNAELIMDPETWLRFDGPAPPSISYLHCVRSLGDIRGKRILDFGCGRGELSTIVAKRGAKGVVLSIFPRPKPEPKPITLMSTVPLLLHLLMLYL